MCSTDALFLINKRKEFFGRTLCTCRENVLENFDYEGKLFYRTTNNERVLFHLYDVDVLDTVLVVEVIVHGDETDPTDFSIGFFIVDITKEENRVTIINESPRILLDDEGDYYLNKKLYYAETELIYSIEIKASMSMINNIVGPNTLYGMREIMPYINPKGRSLEPDKMNIEEIREIQKGPIKSIFDLTFSQFGDDHEPRFKYDW